VPVKITAKVTGVDAVSRAFARMIERTIAGTEQEVTDAADRVRRRAQELLSLGWHPPRTKTGSAPGEPPWRISGALRRAVKVGPVRRKGFSWIVEVGTTRGADGVPYGRIQELGGVTGRGHRTRLPPRPYMAPAWRTVRPTVRPRFVLKWAESTRPRL